AGLTLPEAPVAGDQEVSNGQRWSGESAERLAGAVTPAPSAFGWLQGTAKFSMVLALFLVVAGVVMYTWLYLLHMSSPWFRKHTTIAARAERMSRDLGMGGQAAGDTILVSWDRQSQAIREAGSA